MSCACRVSPWSIFFSSLAQVHRLESTVVREAAILASTKPQWTTHGRILSAARHQRGFHASTTARRESAGDAAAVVKKTAEHPSASTREPEPRRFASLQHPHRGRGSETSPTKLRVRRKDSVETIGTGHKAKTQATPSRHNRPEQAQRAKASAAGSVGESDRLFSAPLTPKLEGWKAQKLALKQKFPEGWRPRKKLSPDALAGIRALNAQFPDVYTTEALADKFAMSAEAIRRILRSKWQPSPDEEQDRQERWFRRGMQVWEQKAALGIKPPKRWRMEGIARDPTHHERSKRAAMREKEIEDMEIEKYKAARPWLKFATRKGEAE